MLPSESTIEEQKRKAIEFFSKQNVNVQAKSNKRGKAQSKAVPVSHQLKICRLVALAVTTSNHFSVCD
jgi:hypothetical protein